MAQSGDTTTLEFYGFNDEGSTGGFKKKLGVLFVITNNSIECNCNNNKKFGNDSVICDSNDKQLCIKNIQIGSCSFKNISKIEGARIIDSLECDFSRLVMTNSFKSIVPIFNEFISLI